MKFFLKASKRGKKDITEILINKGSNINEKDRKGETAFHKCNKFIFIDINKHVLIINFSIK